MRLPSSPCPSFTRRALPAAFAIFVLVGAGCAKDTTTNSGGSAGGSATSSTLPTTYPTIAALQGALEGKGITCTLEYPGLKDDTAQVELSICVIDGEQAYLKVWAKPDQIRQFLDSPDGQSGTVAVGANWTITVATNPVAAKVAAAIGGTAPSGAAATPGATAAS